jgi:hypothetical protein
MISKLRFSLIAVTMLVLLGFGFQDQAKGQVGLNGLFCPAVPDPVGFLETDVFGPSLNSPTPDFTGSLIGTVEFSGGSLVGGLDWTQADRAFFPTTNPTNEEGSQLISWWTQKDGRNTYLQVTNSGPGRFTPPLNNTVELHVRIFNENCLEIRDFCDTYTANDTHEYNFGDLVDNNGNPLADGNLQGVEGWLVVTAVKECADRDFEQAIDYNFLSGQLIVHDSDDYSYGANTYARQAVCMDAVPVVTLTNLVEDGSFQDGFFWRRIRYLGP